jgi:glycosyltransferase involved in cell wall biosynthesis
VRIGIDARNDGTGVGRYTFSLVRELAKLDQTNEYILFLNPRRYGIYAPPGPNFRTVATDIPWFGAREQVQLPRALMRERLDLVHYPHVTVPLLWTPPFVVTIHDLNYLDREAIFSTGSGADRFREMLLRGGYRLTLAKALRARRLIAVSEHTRDALVRLRGVDPRRIAVTYEAADPPANVEPDRETLGRYRLGFPFFLSVGSAYPYKNLRRLIEAFGIFVGSVQCDHRLALAGDYEEFGAELQARAVALGLGERVIFLGPVTEAELAALYEAALAYVFVSRREGFGLPGLEAMQANVPVVAAKAGSLPEIYGEAALYCDPLDAESIAAALREVAAHAELRERLTALGQQRAAEFSWATTAEQTLAVYDEALSSNRVMRP